MGRLVTSSDSDEDDYDEWNNPECMSASERNFPSQLKLSRVSNQLSVDANSLGCFRSRLQQKSIFVGVFLPDFASPLFRPSFVSSVSATDENFFTKTKPTKPPLLRVVIDYGKRT